MQTAPAIFKIYKNTLMENKKGKLTLSVLAMIIMTDVIESFAELFWKKGTLSTGIDNVTFHNFFEFMGKLLGSSGFLTGAGLYVINFFLWITVLSKVDLSVAFPTGSTSYIIVAVLSMVFLGRADFSVPLERHCPHHHRHLVYFPLHPS